MHEHLDVHWTDCEFVVVDVEGNGQTPQEIIEVAASPIVRGKMGLQLREWMVLPTRPVTMQATRIHGISNDDLAGKPRFSEITDELMGALGERVVVGHNVSVDARLLKEELTHWQPPLLLDTLKLARWVLPGLRSYALASLAAERSIDAGGAALHRAAADAFVTAQLFLDLARELDQGGTLSLGKLAEVAGFGGDPFFSNGQRSLF